MGLSIQQGAKHPKSTTMTLSGQINSETSGKLDREMRGLLQQGVRSLVLDLAQVDFVSSAGIGVILNTKKGLEEWGGHLALINLQPQVEKAFEVMALLPTLNIFKNVEELDEYLAKIQDRIREEGSFSDD